MTTTTTETTVRFHVTRDSATAWRDEDVAMCHVDIANGLGTLAEAKTALIDYMNGEIEDLINGRYRSASSLHRAGEIMTGVETVRNISGVPTNKGWTRTEIETCGLIWRIVRVER